MDASCASLYSHKIQEAGKCVLMPCCIKGNHLCRDNPSIQAEVNPSGMLMGVMHGNIRNARGQSGCRNHLGGNERMLLRVVVRSKDVWKSFSEAGSHLLHLNLTCPIHFELSDVIQLNHLLFRCFQYFLAMTELLPGHDTHTQPYRQMMHPWNYCCAASCVVLGLTCCPGDNTEAYCKLQDSCSWVP